MEEAQLLLGKPMALHTRYGIGAKRVWNRHGQLGDYGYYILHSANFGGSVVHSVF